MPRKVQSEPSPMRKEITAYLLKDYQPRNPAERSLVLRMADCKYRVEKIYALQNKVMSEAIETQDPSLSEDERVMLGLLSLTVTEDHALNRLYKMESQCGRNWDALHRSLIALQGLAELKFNSSVN